MVVFRNSFSNLFVSSLIFVFYFHNVTRFPFPDSLTTYNQALVTTKTPPPPKIIRIAHVVNIYSPIDRTQSDVIESMRIASSQSCKKDGTGIDVILLAAVTPNDINIVPTFFNHSFTLRSLYNNRTPLFQEIWGGALHVNADFDYLVYTNADILLDPNFYCVVKKKLIKQSFDVLTINRITLSNEMTFSNILIRNNGEYFTKEEKQKMLHPGDDCFVVERQIAEQLEMGNTYIGQIGFSDKLMIQLSFLAKKPKRFKSFELSATYHIGDDRSWSNEENMHHMKESLLSVVCGEVPNRYHQICEQPKSETLTSFFCQRMNRKIKEKWNITDLPYSIETWNDWCDAQEDTNIKLDTLHNLQ